MPKSKDTAPSEPPWVGLPGGSLEWLAQGIYENLRRRAAQRKRRQAGAGARSEQPAGVTSPVTTPSRAPGSDDHAWSRRNGGIRRRDFYNKVYPAPVGVMEVDRHGGIGVEIMPGHLDEGGVKALEEFLAQLLRYTR